MAKAASAGLTFQHAVGLVVEVALGLGMSVLAAGFLVGGQFGWGAFEGGRVGRGWLGGIGGVLVKSGFEIGKALFVVLNQGPDSGLCSRWDLLPEFVRY